MADEEKSVSASSSTGVDGFDKILSGGFPKGSVVLLAGSSGSGKTIFSFNWLFKGVKDGESSVYITLTEPLFKIVENLERFDYYDRKAIEEERLKIVDIRQIFEGEDFDQKKALNFIEDQVISTGATRLCIDSITAIAYHLDDKSKIRSFIFELGKILAALGCTTILISEVAEKGKYSIYQVEEFISDAIIRFDQVKTSGDLMRVMQIVKVRGKHYTSEELPFKISSKGIVVFPKVRAPFTYPSSDKKDSTGNSALDDMLMGGFFKGSSTLLAGSTGSGKSILSLKFIIDGLENGENCLYAGFEESKGQIIRNAKAFGWDIQKYLDSERLILRCESPSDKLLEEHLKEIADIVDDKKITRCVFDSISTISSHFEPNEFLNFSKRVNNYLKNRAVTTVYTSATASLFGSGTLTGIELSSVTDNIIMMRYVEIEGELKQVINIVKTRGSDHKKDLRSYIITENGIEIGHSLKGFEGIMSGVTRKVSNTLQEQLEQEFSKYLGPMGKQVLVQISQNGLTKGNILSYLESLKKDGILRPDDFEKLKDDIEVIVK